MSNLYLFNFIFLFVCLFSFGGGKLQIQPHHSAIVILVVVDRQTDPVPPTLLKHRWPHSPDVEKRLVSFGVKVVYKRLFDFGVATELGNRVLSHAVCTGGGWE